MISYRLYSILSRLITPYVRYKIRARIRIGKEDPQRVQERFGQTSCARPAGPLLWIHAASVGEVQSTRPLIDRVVEDFPALSILVTTGTVTAAKIVETQFPKVCRHQYIPYDICLWVTRFLEHWRPDFICWVASEFWPHTLTEIHCRKIPIVLLNGSVSEKSLRRWRFMTSLLEPLLKNFKTCFAQSKQDAKNLSDLGATSVRPLGNLKFSAPPLPVDLMALKELQKQIGTRPLWLAASTHPGEEALVLEAHQRVLKRFKEALCIIVPRHPSRAEDVALLVKEAGMVCAQRSYGENVEAHTSVYLADTLGELGLFYALSPQSFVGGSLVSVGGHNLVEPARLGSAMIHGPHMENCQDTAKLFHQAGATYEIQEAGGLADSVLSLLATPEVRDAMVEGARKVIAEQSHVIDVLMTELAPSFAKLSPIPSKKKVASCG